MGVEDTRCECGHEIGNHPGVYSYDVSRSTYCCLTGCPCPAFKPVEDLATKAWKRVGKHMRSALPLAQEADSKRVMCACGFPMSPENPHNHAAPDFIRGSSGKTPVALRSPQLDEEELEHLLDIHAVYYSQTTCRYIAQKITEAELHELWHVQDLKTKAALLAWARKGR